MTEHERVPPLGEIKATRRDVHDRPPQTRAPAKTSAGGYREFDLLLSESPPRALGLLQQWLAVLVRLMGLCFLTVGIGAAVVILNEAWMLYKEPVRIERFALAIERGSNLDKIFALSSSEIVKTSDQGDTPGDSSVSSSTSEPADKASLRLSYFAGWFLVLLLMLVASITAIAAVSAGGRLVLYDTDIRQLSRAVIKQVRRGKGD